MSTRAIVEAVVEDWRRGAQRAWKGLKPVRPESFARVDNQVHIVVEGHPLVVVVEGRDLDKLRSILPK